MDPFQILNLSPTSDKKKIKRAYRRMAMKYHPDMVTNQDTSAEARKKANEEFAKINWAYAQLSGKNGARRTTTSTTSSSSSGNSGTRSTATSTSSSSTSSSSSYSPPHRRTSSNTYNHYKVSTDGQDHMHNPFPDWQDFIFRYDSQQVHDKQVSEKQVYNKQAYGKQAYGKQVHDKQVYDKQVYDKQVHDKQVHEKQVYGKQVHDKQVHDKQVHDKQVYDKGSDSFDKIISDLFEGATVGAARVVGGKGIFRDFVELLESNVSGSAKEVDNVKLRTLLKTGSVEDVGKEMNAAELVVQQMDLKRRNLANELVILRAHLTKMGLVEKVAEVEARQQVVDGNLKKARKWLLALQTRYYELLLRGDNDVSAGGSDRSWDPQSSATASPGATSSASPRGEPTDSCSSSSEEDAGKHQEFGSSGRGLGRILRDFRSGGQRSSWQPQSSSTYSTSSPGATSSVSSKGTSIDRSTDSLSASSEEDASKHEGYSLSGRRRGSSRKSQGSDGRSGEYSNSWEPKSPSPCSTSSSGATSSASSKGTSIDRSTDSLSASSAEDAWTIEGYGSNGKGRGRSRKSQESDVRSKEHSNSWEPQSSSSYSTSPSGTTSSSSSTGASSDCSSDSLSASSEGDAWNHEGYGSNGKGRGSSRRSQ
jgi:hypothetical protein